MILAQSLAVWQEDVSKLVGGLISAAMRNAVTRDNAVATKKGIERGGSSLAVHSILSAMVNFMNHRDFLQSKHYLINFFGVLKVGPLLHPCQCKSSCRSLRVYAI